MTRILVLAWLCLCCFATEASNPSAFDHNALILKTLLRKVHVSPPVEDERFYAQLFHDFLEQCDPNKIYFLESDIQLLKTKQSLFVEEINGKNHSFFTEFIPLYKMRVVQCDSLVNKVTAQPFDFTVKEFYSWSDSTYCKDKSTLQDRCRKYLKYISLRKLVNKLDYDSTVTASSLLKSEPIIRAKTVKEMNRNFEPFFKNKSAVDTLCFYLLYKSIAAAFDPHTIYFTASLNEKFNSLISGEEKLFGFSIDENNKGQIILNKIVPGSAAWRSGEINNEDILLAARSEKGDWVDFSGEDKQSANELFETIMADKMEFYLQKTDGNKKNLLLQKEKIKPEDNFVRSWVINGTHKIGYLLLPGFYTDIDNSKGAHCADDVAKEILKLKAENVEGLVLDLRDNGGGSMHEAEQLAGMFINEGVLDLMRYQTGKPLAKKDPNRGVLTDLPLAVMLNGASASASEMLASTLQDYNRAVIVGATSYGKASSQVVFPLDSSVDLYNLNESKKKTTEFVKITIGKFYRPSGKSCQLIGVKPDILLPDLTKTFGFAESESTSCLSSDTVSRAVYFTPLPPLPIQTLSKQSNERVASTTYFLQIDATKTKISSWKAEESRPVPLNWEAYIAKWKDMKIKYKLPSHEPDKASTLAVTNHSFDKEQMVVDRQRKEIDTKAIVDISKDPYLIECIAVISDLIGLQKK